jgi:hypothetical protein
VWTDGVTILADGPAQYTPGAGDVGKDLYVVVLASASGAETVWRAKNVGTVQPAPVPDVVTPPVPGVTPPASAGKDAHLPKGWAKIRPDFTGKLKVGAKLKAVPGPVPAGSKVKLQWMRDGKVIKGATKATYKTTAKDKGRKVTLRQTTVTPAKKKVVQTSVKRQIAAKSVKIAQGTVKLTGTAKAGKKLTAKTAKWGKSKSLYFKWVINGKTVKGAWGKSTFTLPKTVKPGDKVYVLVRGAAKKSFANSAAQVSKSRVIA